MTFHFSPPKSNTNPVPQQPDGVATHPTNNQSTESDTVMEDTTSSGTAAPSSGTTSSFFENTANLISASALGAAGQQLSLGWNNNNSNNHNNNNIATANQDWSSFNAASFGSSTTTTSAGTLTSSAAAPADSGFGGASQSIWGASASNHNNAMAGNQNSSSSGAFFNSSSTTSSASTNTATSDGGNFNIHNAASATPSKAIATLATGPFGGASNSSSVNKENNSSFYNDENNNKVPSGGSLGSNGTSWQASSGAIDSTSSNSMSFLNTNSNGANSIPGKNISSTPTASLGSNTSHSANANSNASSSSIGIKINETFGDPDGESNNVGQKFAPNKGDVLFRANVSSNKNRRKKAETARQKARNLKGAAKYDKLTGRTLSPVQKKDDRYFRQKDFGTIKKSKIHAKNRETPMQQPIGSPASSKETSLLSNPATTSFMTSTDGNLASTNMAPTTSGATTITANSRPPNLAVASNHAFNAAAAPTPSNKNLSPEEYASLMDQRYNVEKGIKKEKIALACLREKTPQLEERVKASKKSKEILRAKFEEAMLAADKNITEEQGILSKHNDNITARESNLRSLICSATSVGLKNIPRTPPKRHRPQVQDEQTQFSDPALFEHKDFQRIDTLIATAHNSKSTEDEKRDAVTTLHDILKSMPFDKVMQKFGVDDPRCATTMSEDTFKNVWRFLKYALLHLHPEFKRALQFEIDRLVAGDTEASCPLSRSVRCWVEFANEMNLAFDEKLLTVAEASVQKGFDLEVCLNHKKTSLRSTWKNTDMVEGRDRLMDIFCAMWPGEL